MHSSSVRLGALLAAVAISLAACGGGDSTSSPGAASAAGSTAESAAPSEAASMEESSAPSMAPIDITGAADAVSDLTSYNLDIVIESSESGTQSMSITAVHDPVNATHYVTDEFELISIEGEGVWINQGGTWVAAPGDADMYMSMFNALAPDTLISSFSLGLYGSDLHDVGTEEHNSVQTTHYHLDASDMAGMGDTGFPDDGVIDLWIATDGGYLVGMQYGGTDPETGEKIQMSMEVSGVNDPSISIEPPI